MILSLTVFGIELFSIALFTASQAQEPEAVDNTGGDFSLPFGFCSADEGDDE